MLPTSGMGTLQVWRTAGSRLHRLHWLPRAKSQLGPTWKLAGKLGAGLETLDSESGSWNNPSINNRSHGGTVPASAERPDSEGRTG